MMQNEEKLQLQFGAAKQLVRSFHDFSYLCEKAYSSGF
jgi:hypothetical protein